MSERTAPSLAKLDELIPRLDAARGTPDADRLVDEAQALRRAVAAFHMEAIRFRMHAVDRLINATGDDVMSRRLFEELRTTLEAAGFHTRSHAAPTKAE
jgi:hypothetical protein